MIRTGTRIASLAAAAAFAVITLASQLPVQAADMRGTTWTITGADKLHYVTREISGNGFKRTMGNEKDIFPITITFDSTGTATSGTFSITQYESFPVVGTWSSTKENKVTLTVDQAQLQSDLTNEVCPAASCVLESSWLPFKATLHQSKTRMNLEFVERIKWTNPDTTFEKQRYIFTGKGPLVLTPPAGTGSSHAAHRSNKR